MSRAHSPSAHTQPGSVDDSDRPVRFRTRIKGEYWGDWCKPGIDGWRVAAAEREFIKPRSTLSGLCIEYAAGNRVTHFPCADEAEATSPATPTLGGDGEAVHQKAGVKQEGEQ